MTAVLERANLRGTPMPESSTTMCVAGGRPHQITDRDGHPVGGYICDNHLAALGNLLRAVEEEARTLILNPDDPESWSVRPTLQINYGSAGGSSKGGAPAFTKSPARLDAIMLTDARTSTAGKREPGPFCQDCPHGSCRDRRAAHEDQAAGATGAVNPLAVLTGYAARVREHRQLTTPTSTHRQRDWALEGPVCDGDCTHESCDWMWITWTAPVPPTIRSERDILSRNLEWIARQPWVADLWTDTRDVLDRLQRVNGTAPPPAEGRCPTLIDGKECGGPIYRTEPTHTVGEWNGAAGDAFRCMSCGRRWEGRVELARLALMTHAQRHTPGRNPR